MGEPDAAGVFIVVGVLEPEAGGRRQGVGQWHLCDLQILAGESEGGQEGVWGGMLMR